MHVRRFPNVTREVHAAGHEIGNHTDTHPRLWLKSSRFVIGELSRTQEAIGVLTGTAPRHFRATYGVRWFGVRRAQAQLGLLNVMWTTIGRDWKLSAAGVTDRLIHGACNGAIFCLHDGRERAADPDIRNTVASVRRVLPVLQDRGYRFVTVRDLLR
jgi:peptidoglycan-N-acetylglucosamine deacetylase